MRVLASAALVVATGACGATAEPPPLSMYGGPPVSEDSGPKDAGSSDAAKDSGAVKDDAGGMGTMYGGPIPEDAGPPQDAGKDSQGPVPAYGAPPNP